MKAANPIMFKMVKVSAKGQIAIPVEIQREVGIKKGDELILFRKGNRMVLEKPQGVMELLEDEFSDLQAFTEASLGQIWLNKQDEVWNQYLKPRKR